MKILRYFLFIFCALLSLQSMAQDGRGVCGGGDFENCGCSFSGILCGWAPSEAEWANGGIVALNSDHTLRENAEVVADLCCCCHPCACGSLSRKESCVSGWIVAVTMPCCLPFLPCIQAFLGLPRTVGKILLD